MAGRKAELLGDIDEGWTKLNTFLDMLTPAQWSELHDDVGWSVKDHLTHLTAWERFVTFFLQGQPAYITFGVDPALLAEDIDAVNAVIQQHTARLSVEEARAESRQAHAELLEALQRLNDEDLSKPNSDYAPLAMGQEEESPVINLISSNTTEHYAEHLPWIENLISK